MDALVDDGVGDVVDGVADDGFGEGIGHDEVAADVGAGDGKAEGVFGNQGTGFVVGSGEDLDINGRF